MAVNTKSHSKIGPTAWYVASQRALSDIKYAKVVFEAIRPAMESATPEEREYLKNAGTNNLAPMFEARYKLTDKIIDHSGITQIMEIAAGLSPRGLAYTDYPDFIFVESDLPHIIREKRDIIRNITGERPNLYLEEVDAMDGAALMHATRHFAQQPIAIVTEGLLRYLSMDEKAAVARNIHGLLEKFGGFWVTPDVAMARQHDRRDNTPGHQEGVLKLSGIDLQKNKFADTASGEKFMEELGFEVQRVPLMEVADELASPKAVGISMEEVRESFEGRETFVMKVRKTQRGK